MESNALEEVVVVSIPESKLYEVNYKCKELVWIGRFDVLQVKDNFILNFEGLQFMVTPDLRVTKNELDHFVILTSTYDFGLILGSNTPKTAIKVLQKVFSDYAKFSVHYTNRAVSKTIQYIEQKGTCIREKVSLIANYLSEKMKNFQKVFRTMIKPRKKPVNIEKKHFRRLTVLREAADSVALVFKEFLLVTSAISSKFAQEVLDRIQDLTLMKQVKELEPVRNALIMGESVVSTSAEVSKSVNEAVGRLSIEANEFTIGLVDHQYGEQVAAVAREGLAVVGQFNSIYQGALGVALETLITTSAINTAKSIAAPKKPVCLYNHI